MDIRLADLRDLSWLAEHDHHVSEAELRSLIGQRRILMAEADGEVIGWLRWNLFWDNTPFMNMLYFLESWRRCGHGRKLVGYWEQMMHSQGYERVLTSSQSNEEGQHFYRSLGYADAGALLLPGEPLEIIFCKDLDALGMAN